jgi:hypothetical protein
VYSTRLQVLYILSLGYREGRLVLIPHDLRFTMSSRRLDVPRSLLIAAPHLFVRNVISIPYMQVVRTVRSVASQRHPPICLISPPLLWGTGLREMKLPNLSISSVPSNSGEAREGTVCPARPALSCKINCAEFPTSWRINRLQSRFTLPANHIHFDPEL